MGVGASRWPPPGTGGRAVPDRAGRVGGVVLLRRCGDLRRQRRVEGLGARLAAGRRGLRRRTRAHGRRPSSGPPTHLTVHGADRAARDRGRLPRHLRHRPDAGGGGAVRPYARRRSPASGSSATRRPTAIAATVTELRRCGIRRRGARRRDPDPPGHAPTGDGADLRRPSDGDELRPARTGRPGHPHRRSGLCREDLPRLLGRRWTSLRSGRGVR